MVKVGIILPTGEFARHAIFYDFYSQIIKDPGTIQAVAHGQSPARNRNHLIEVCLAQDCTHILFLDDDTAPPPDIIEKLMRHDKDIVTGLYLHRQFPHKPIIFDTEKEDGMMGYHWLKDGEDGLVEVVNCGLGACLIKAEVFKTMLPDCPKQDVKTPPTWIRLGQLKSAIDHWGDDTEFFIRVKNYGYKIYCDLSVLVGHIGTCIIRPEYHDGKWLTSYDTSGESRLTFPAVRPANVVTG